MIYLYTLSSVQLAFRDRKSSEVIRLLSAHLSGLDGFLFLVGEVLGEELGF